MWLPLTCPHMGTWPTTQACALTWNLIGDPLVFRLVLIALSHTSQGLRLYFILDIIKILRMNQMWIMKFDKSLLNNFHLTILFVSHSISLSFQIKENLRKSSGWLKKKWTLRKFLLFNYCLYIWIHSHNPCVCMHK